VIEAIITEACRSATEPTAESGTVEMLPSSVGGVY